MIKALQENSRYLISNDIKNHNIKYDNYKFEYAVESQSTNEMVRII